MSYDCKCLLQNKQLNKQLNNCNTDPPDGLSPPANCLCENAAVLHSAAAFVFFTLLNFLEKSSEMMKCRGSCEDIWGRSHGNAESCVVTQKCSKGTCEDMKTDSSKQWIKSTVNLNKHLSAGGNAQRKNHIGGRGGDVGWRRSGGWMSQPGDIINDLMYGTFTCSQLFQTSFRCDDALDESKFPDKWPQSLVPTFMFLRGCFVHPLPAQPFHQPQLDFHVSC